MEEQRREAGCIARRMQPDLHHGLLDIVHGHRPMGSSRELESKRRRLRGIPAASERQAQGRRIVLHQPKLNQSRSRPLTCH